MLDTANGRGNCLPRLFYYLALQDLLDERGELRLRARACALVHDVENAVRLQSSPFAMLSICSLLGSGSPGYTALANTGCEMS